MMAHLGGMDVHRFPVARLVLRLTRLLGCVLLLAAGAPPDAAPGPSAAPGWAAAVVGQYAGRVLNAGRMQCHRTVLSLQGGQLVGHYWIDDDTPFEGELTGFVPDASGASGGGHAGTFTWTDRFGTGHEYLAFAPDGSGFRGFWGGAQPLITNPVWAVRSDRPCEAQVSQARPPARAGSHV